MPPLSGGRSCDVRVRASIPVTLERTRPDGCTHTFEGTVQVEGERTIEAKTRTDPGYDAVDDIEIVGVSGESCLYKAGRVIEELPVALDGKVGHQLLTTFPSFDLEDYEPDWQDDDPDPADDGEPADIDDDSHYDPYTGGDDFLREHGEDCHVY
jgi:hypothetical protein